MELEIAVGTRSAGMDDTLGDPLVVNWTLLAHAPGEAGKVPTSVNLFAANLVLQ